MGIKHAKVSAKSDGGDATLVTPSDWNDEHVISGLSGAGLITAVSYATAATTASTTIVDVDATNLAPTFTVPNNGKVLVQLQGMVTTVAQDTKWGLRDGSNNPLGTDQFAVRYTDGSTAIRVVNFYLTGLTPGASLKVKWGHYMSGGSGSTTFLAATRATMLVFAEDAVSGGGGADLDVSPNPTSDDDEFRTTDTSDPMTGWTTLGTPTAHDINSTLKSHYYVKKTQVGATTNINGIYKSVPSIPFTVTAKLSDYVAAAINYQRGGQLFIGEAGGTGKLESIDTILHGVASGPSHVEVIQYTNRTTFGSGIVASTANVVGAPVYLRIVVTSSTNVSYYYSNNGSLWTPLTTGRNPGFTVGIVGLSVDPENASYDAEAVFDWVRFGTNVTQPEATLWQNVGGSGGGLVLLEQHTASASATLDFTTAISATYDDYIIKGVQLVNATDAVNLTVQFSSDGGSSWLATTYRWGYSYTGAAAGGHVGSTSDTSIHLGNAIQAGTSKSVSFQAELFDPGAGAFTQMHYSLSQRNSGDSNLYFYAGAGEYGVGTAIDALRFAFSSGNITSGTIRVYGVAKG